VKSDVSSFHFSAVRHLFLDWDGVLAIALFPSSLFFRYPFPFSRGDSFLRAGSVFLPGVARPLSPKIVAALLFFFFFHSRGLSCFVPRTMFPPPIRRRFSDVLPDTRGGRGMCFAPSTLFEGIVDAPPPCGTLPLAVSATAAGTYPSPFLSDSETLYSLRSLFPFFSLADPGRKPSPPENRFFFPRGNVLSSPLLSSMILRRCLLKNSEPRSPFAWRVSVHWHEPFFTIRLSSKRTPSPSSTFSTTAGDPFALLFCR